MKLRLAVISLMIILFACSAKESNTPVELKTKKDSISYALGVQMISGFKEQEMKDLINVDVVVKAMKDVYGGEGAIADEELERLFMDFQNEFRNAQQAMKARQGEENKKAGQEFLAANKAKEGVQVTESGLQYEVITQAGGPKPKATDKVKVHYHGTFVNGDVFDSSVERGQPATFGLNQVIPGWTEGLQLMSVGSKFKFVIPYELAYGEQGNRGIPAASTLIFEVELLEIVK